MLPISGPFTTSKGSLSSDFYQAVTSYRQKKPYNLPTAMTSERLELYSKSSPSDTAATFSGISPNESSLRNQAYAKAYAKLVDQLGSASLGATLATYRQSVTMIEQRASQMLRFVRHLKRGNLLAAGKALGSPDVSRYRRHNLSKKLSGQILETNFGWLPLVGDMQDAMTILESPIPIGKLRGRGNSGYVLTIDKPLKWDPPYQYLDWGSEKSQYCGVTCGTDVRMTNPNLALATALGLTDPMEVLFEVTPWSFVLDWFSNASQFLTSWNDFFGYSLENSFSTTIHIRFTKMYSNTQAYPAIGRGSSVRVSRSLGLPQPSFHLKPFRLPVVRAANIMSLLVQQLPRH